MKGALPYLLVLLNVTVVTVRRRDVFTRGTVGKLSRIHFSSLHAKECPCSGEAGSTAQLGILWSGEEWEVKQVYRYFFGSQTQFAD